jgi:hypothetical protein
MRAGEIGIYRNFQPFLYSYIVVLGYEYENPIVAVKCRTALTAKITTIK